MSQRTHQNRIAEPYSVPKISRRRRILLWWAGRRDGSATIPSDCPPPQPSKIQELERLYSASIGVENTWYQTECDGLLARIWAARGVTVPSLPTGHGPQAVRERQAFDAAVALIEDARQAVSELDSLTEVCKSRIFEIDQVFQTYAHIYRGANLRRNKNRAALEQCWEVQSLVTHAQVAWVGKPTKLITEAIIKFGVEQGLREASTAAD